MQQDLNSAADLEVLLRDFYANVLRDPVIGYIFTDIARIDLEQHLPIVVNFWSDLLFSSTNYSGDLFGAHKAVHAHAPLKPGHFTRWLYLFKAAVARSPFEGPQTRAIIRLAERIAKSMSAALTQQKRRELTLTLDELSALGSRSRSGSE